MIAPARALAVVVALGLGLGGAVIGAAPASAADLTVTDPGDTNAPGTLRWALSNLDPGVANTITITVSGTITAATDLPDITESVSITGPGEANLTIDTPGTVFTVIGSTPPITVGFSGLTITSAGASACGIESVDADVTVTNVTASDFDCSGISVQRGSLTATDVTVERDATGIAFVGADATDTLTLTRVHAGESLFSGVNAVIWGAVGTLVDVDADDSQIFGIYIGTTQGGTTTASGLRADRSGAFGIIALADGGSAATVTDSSATDGAGQGFNLQATDHATLTAARITSTASGSSGFWLSATDSATVTVQSSLAQGGFDASGIWIDQADDATVAISGTQLIGNTSDFGAGVYVREALDGGTVAITGSTISGNHATDDGGGIHVDVLSDDGSSVTIADSTVSGNTSGGRGGGISLNQPGLVTSSTARVDIVRTTVDGNVAGGHGGGIAVFDPAGEPSGQPTVLIDRSTISNNTTTTAGGGLYAGKYTGSYAAVEVVNSTLSGNAAQAGGGVYAEAAGGGGPVLLTTAIRSSTITDNTANSSGGIETNPGNHELVVYNSIVAGNGGTLDLQLGAPYSVSWSLIENPAAALAFGPADGVIVGVDPKLGPLAANGGTTLTHLLGPGSPAFNAGDPAYSGTAPFDQRDLDRVYQIIDMGSVEWHPALAVTGQVVTPGPPLVALLLLFSGLAMVAFSRIQLVRSIG